MSPPNNKRDIIRPHILTKGESKESLMNIGVAILAVLMSTLGVRANAKMGPGLPQHLQLLVVLNYLLFPTAMVFLIAEAGTNWRLQGWVPFTIGLCGGTAVLLSMFLYYRRRQTGKIN